MLQTIDLNIGYEQKIIQCNLNVKASNGILVCLLGTNGCGKSGVDIVECLFCGRCGKVAVVQ